MCGLYACGIYVCGMCTYDVCVSTCVRAHVLCICVMWHRCACLCNVQTFCKENPFKSVSSSLVAQDLLNLEINSTSCATGTSGG